MSEVPDEVLLARAAWSRLTEPGDPVAGALVGVLGPVEAWDLVRGSLGAAGAVGAAGSGGSVGRSGRAGASGSSGVASRASSAPDAMIRAMGSVLPTSARSAHRLATALERWGPRLAAVDAPREVHRHRARGGHLVVPEDPRWPRGLDDLGVQAPHALWVCGDPSVLTASARGAAVIGARACTAYGEHVTAEVVAGVVGAGRVVVSGGAYGIDAAAHRAALASGGVTVAVLAGGVDRLYPAGNARLLRAAQDSGALVSEVPPGGVPSRQRFLQRNRLIAALSGATVVVEAAWRSGALSTASRAAALLRPVGAVPGPVTSAASAGCHRLLRDGAAVCVTDAPEVLELLAGAGPAPVPDTAVGRSATVADGLDPVARRVLDALPVRAWADVASVTRVAGVSAPEARGALGLLELAGLADRDGDRWRRSASRSGAPGG
nr:DNA-processing protein DprA [uncultured Actinotalea sp.]